MQRDAPVRLLVATAICIVIANVLVAQVIAQTFYADAGTRLGPVVLAVLSLAALAAVTYVVLGWRAYLRHRPD